MFAIDSDSRTDEGSAPRLDIGNKYRETNPTIGASAAAHGRRTEVADSAKVMTAWLHANADLIGLALMAGILFFVVAVFLQLRIVAGLNEVTATYAKLLVQARIDDEKEADRLRYNAKRDAEFEAEDEAFRREAFPSLYEPDNPFKRRS